jgi:hypothetical protein
MVTNNVIRSGCVALLGLRHIRSYQQKQPKSEKYFIMGNFYGIGI